MRCVNSSRDRKSSPFNMKHFKMILRTFNDLAKSCKQGGIYRKKSQNPEIK